MKAGDDVAVLHRHTGGLEIESGLEVHQDELHRHTGGLESFAGKLG